jgi:hypothetical protein
MEWLTFRAFTSAAGLYTARVCADHFENVVIIDPDNETLLREASSSPERPENQKETWNPRPRVYQTRSIHGTQVPQMLGLERLFPGFKAKLKARGVP